MINTEVSQQNKAFRFLQSRLGNSALISFVLAK